MQKIIITTRLSAIILTIKINVIAIFRLNSHQLKTLQTLSNINACSMWEIDRMSVKNLIKCRMNKYNKTANKCIFSANLTHLFIYLFMSSSKVTLQKPAVVEMTTIKLIFGDQFNWDTLQTMPFIHGFRVVVNYALCSLLTVCMIVYCATLPRCCHLL